MATKGAGTRERILDTAEQLVLQLGFGSTSIDKVLEGSGITKGAFFYHFHSKAELGRALVERYARRDDAVLESTMARAERLASDPLGQLVVFLGLCEEHAESVGGPNPGCLFASYVYEAQLFDEEVKEIIGAQFLRWRKAIRSKLDDVVKTHPPARVVDLDELADLFSTVFEGGFVMAKSLRDPKIIARHLAHYRHYVELLFTREEGRPGKRSRPAAPRGRRRRSGGA